jgi:hypothetical protein
MERGTEILASSDPAQLDPLREHNQTSDAVVERPHLTTPITQWLVSAYLRYPV